MRDAEPKVIRLQDYQVPNFQITKTELHFNLEPTETLVTSKLQFERNAKSENKSAALELHGQDIEIQSLKINGEELTDEQYQVNPESLTVFSVPDVFEFECIGKINPQENTSLEGLYKSRSMFCTQCEAEGFRKITYYLDRPDVMSEFTTTVEADKALYPILLSNGNPIEKGELDNNRHFVTWHDPHKKPAYLFALVAGDLSVLDDTFTTSSGRDVALKIFVEPKDLDKCDHAMTSLKNAMKWDEDVYGREYDLDIFMIVAVDDFNMGAMENKGLNIFNTSCVLAKAETTSDTGFQRVEAVVAHEYFHNWSGNRVTCRDWFQLSLKEGFTVFRDSEFSADMGSRTVKRVEDANVLRTLQFAEDAGPMAHPVQPPSFIEISNFYTLTIYEKGAEVVRMIHTLLGAETFRKGSDIYFAENDGTAATIDDFISAMSKASGKDFTQFMTWYRQAGTPVLNVADNYDAENQKYTLTFAQSCPDTPEAKSEDKKPYLIPVRLGLLGESGPLPLEISDLGISGVTDTVVEITESTQCIEFSNVSEKPVPSLLRSLSAPVKLQFDYSRDQLIKIMSSDEDGFNRWEASQQLCVQVIQELMSGLQSEKPVAVDPNLVAAFDRLLKDDDLDPAMVANMLSLPSESYLAELAEEIDVDAIHQCRAQLKKTLAEELCGSFAQRWQKTPATVDYKADAEQIGLRSIRNMCLSYLVASGQEQWFGVAYEQFSSANNMTDQFSAMSALVHSDSELAESYASKALAEFYQQWSEEALVVNQWFGVQASKAHPNTLEQVKALMEHPAFTMKNPNKVRSVIGAFANNPVCFHAIDGSGYKFLADQIIELNALNPQIAARLLTPLTRWKKQTQQRQALMIEELKRIQFVADLSKDVYEVVSKSLV
ncbi:aminopeptidase N [Sessilibacter corallicola]|uniref:aminopeptidase N n=1 Tax=Sessilibacter corallicola TaxID=2904075 RepID=UPI001E431CEB|nr:aminopeptidase N [Sessilibacter corallicola]MCE2029895.1 aminopeptidase N [Sessilibacter corallicola]